MHSVVAAQLVFCLLSLTQLIQDGVDSNASGVGVHLTDSCHGALALGAEPF